MKDTMKNSATVEVALVKGTDAYDWFVYMGKPLDMRSRLGTSFRLEKGDRFGVRKSANGKSIRFVAEELGVSKVFTLDMDIANQLAKNSKVSKVKPR